MPSSDDRTVLPVFPLTGTLLLPGNFLPLNVFERRYRNLVSDVLAGEKLLGMIQPRLPAADNWGLGPPAEERPELYSVGCVGRIEECEPQADGRYVIVLKGVRRFRVREELAERRGYRRVVAGLEEFVGDLDGDDAGVDRRRLLAAVEGFSDRHGLEFDAELLAALPPLSLLHALAAALPFEPGEKQALLEAPSAERRQEILLSLMGMGLQPQPAADRFAPPVIN